MNWSDCANELLIWKSQRPSASVRRLHFGKRLQYAENIVETVREPLVVLDIDLNRLANRSFYNTFKVTPDETIGNFIYDLGDQQWDIPRLRTLFEDILPKNTQFDNFEVEHNFPIIGRKIMLLNARRIHRKRHRYANDPSCH